MHGHHEDITKVNLLLTEPSQVSKSSMGEGKIACCTLSEARVCLDGQRC